MSKFMGITSGRAAFTGIQDIILSFRPIRLLVFANVA
jgi:hypothetical protein